ncbi:MULTISPECIES: TatD family hydrolase [unclassified Flavobacterium]|jgi:TatD DNase family protein|uniref:TatD family hydrolase n=1 Tax=unclassified Flavobacterium TaxID=196869 RepID=UPI0025BBF5A5|nr:MULTISPECIES: TatD family hydrolase [unclassified Flavobacterium]
MQFFNLHTHKFTNQPEVLELVNQYPQEFDAAIPFYSIGIHPWYIDEKRLENDLETIESKLQEKKCLAVGECGLDKRIEIPFDLQQLVFEKQLILAEKHQKPVVIHCVAAFQEVIEIKKKLNITVPMLIHGFSKNEQVAKQLIDNGFYISVGKYLLRNPELETVFKSIPNDKFFLETDTIAEGIQEVYALAARYKGLELNELQEIINKNYNKVFENMGLETVGRTGIA